jgi:transmembrane sensor
MKDYRNICIKYIAGEITQAEKKLLEVWIDASNENRQIFEEIKKIWESTKPVEISEMPDIENEWKLLINRINTAETKKYSPFNSFINKIINVVFLPTWKPVLAGSLIILIIISALSILHQDKSFQLRLIMTANKERRNIQLSDGTLVYLNSGSRINFPDKFSEKKREIRLSGEAYFSVKKDSRPFIVITENARTTVLGTKFNVWSRNEKTRVTVKEGLVSLTPKSTENKVLISRGQQSEIIKNLNPTPPVKVNSVYLLGWMDNRLTFDKTPLKEIVAELERSYNVQLTLKNKNLEEYTLTGSFRNKDIDSVLSAICLTLDITYEKNNESYVIK